MKRFSVKSLRMRLNLIVLLTVVPAWVLVLYTAAEQRSLEQEVIYQNALMLTRAIADEEYQMLRSARTTLSIMAELVSHAGNSERRACGGFDGFLKNSPQYLQLGVLSPDGRVSCRAGAAGPARPFSDYGWFVETVRSRKLTLGATRVEMIDGRPAIYAARPVIDETGGVVRVVYAALNLDWVSRPAFRILGHLPEGATLVQIDPAQGQLVYDSDSRRWTEAKALDETLVRSVTDRGSGVISDEDGGKKARIYAFASLSSPLKGGRTVSAVLVLPKARAFAASNRILSRNLILLGLVALAAIVVVWVTADRFFLRPLESMAAASQRLAEGDLDTRIGDISSADELRRLARSFDDMAQALQTRMVREQEAKRQLESSREQLRNLTGYLQDVREQERTRIARELHDDFGQSLTILKFDLSWMKKRLPSGADQIVEKLGAMGQVIDSALETMHAVTAELRPVILDDFGLSAALEWQTEEFKNRTGIDCRIETDPDLPEVPHNLATAVFRIFQETLTNIMRHAEAGRVDVRLKKDGAALVLEVEDDGRGITEEQIKDPRSFGIIGIRERLHPFGGQLRFEDGHGGGTRVTVAIPIEEENSAS